MGMSKSKPEHGAIMAPRERTWHLPRVANGAVGSKALKPLIRPYGIRRQEEKNLPASDLEYVTNVTSSEGHVSKRSRSSITSTVPLFNITDKVPGRIGRKQPKRSQSLPKSQHFRKRQCRHCFPPLFAHRPIYLRTICHNTWAS